MRLDVFLDCCYKIQMEKIEKQIRFLIYYSGFLTLLCAVLFVNLLRGGGLQHFKEIDVERINVREANGKLRMVLSNKARQHPGVMDGITYEERRGQRPPGLMFFNEKGDEQGGLVFDGNAGTGQGGSLTFDKFRSDQTIQFLHEEEPDGKYFAGIKMSDQNMPLNERLKKQEEISKIPSKEEQDAAFQKLRDQGMLMTERLKIGRDTDQSSILKLKDAQGKVRIELRVTAGGEAKLNFLNDSGAVVYSLPPSAAGKR